VTQIIDLTELASKICFDNGFILIKKVGAGAFKQTFLINDSLGVSYALKIFLENNNSERQAREIDAMKRCSHSHIAKFYHLNECLYDNVTHIWLLEEFIDGGSLAERLQKKEPLDFKKFAVQMISAIEHIYSLDLVHRDIKPDNIMFRVNGDAVLVDFGLVRDLKQSSLTATWIMGGPGTPLFSSPEQLNNEKALIDWRADQFAIGLVFSLVLFDRHPFQYPSDNLNKAVMRMALKESPSEVFKKAIQESNSVFLGKMIEAWPINRFRRPSDLLSALA
jgi:serine/threonine protein kinase